MEQTLDLYGIELKGSANNFMKAEKYRKAYKNLCGSCWNPLDWLRI